MITPEFPNPTGPGMGIANTLENPAGDILLLDSAFMEPRSAASAGSADVDAPDMTAVMFMSPKVVTLVGDGWFYVQSLERIGGLKVIGAKEGLNAGMHVLLQGTMGTQGPERVLLMTSCEILTTPIVGDPSSAILPLGMPNRTVGGAGTGYVPGFAGMAGLRNSAQLIRTWGKVTDIGGGFFYIDDGSSSRDGTQYTGLRVILPSGVNPPAKDAYIAITGISSWFVSGGYGFPAVLLGSGDDVTVIKPGT